MLLLLQLENGTVKARTLEHSIIMNQQAEILVSTILKM